MSVVVDESSKELGSRSSVNLLSKAMFFVFLLFLFTRNAESSIIIGGNKIYFFESRESLDVSVRNVSNQTYLLISRIVSEEERFSFENKILAKKFIVIPPAVSVHRQGERILRITKGNIKSLPSDRESMHYLSVTAIPDGNVIENSVQIAVRTWVKLIYRPLGLTQSRTPDVKFKREKGQVIAKNTTPYYTFLSEVNVNGKEYESSITLEPFSEVHLYSCEHTLLCRISYKTYHDDGSISEIKNTSI